MAVEDKPTETEGLPITVEMQSGPKNGSAAFGVKILPVTVEAPVRPESTATAFSAKKFEDMNLSLPASSSFPTESYMYVFS